MKSIDNPNGIVGSLKDSLDGILGVRDDIGAALMPVYLVTRTWSGTENGSGSLTEVKVQITPSPRIVKIADASRVVPGGAVQLGDIFLKMISKNAYPAKTTIDGTSDDQSVEKVYEVDGELYSVQDVTEKHLTWTVMIRKRTNQVRPEEP